MISFDSGGSTKGTEAFLQAMVRGDYLNGLESLAQEGVNALRAATPRESGATADGWFYEIAQTAGTTTIYWKNSNIIDGFNVAVGLQYGHGTGTGGWIEGYDYINPALKPIFDAIADKMWREVQNS